MARLRHPQGFTMVDLLVAATIVIFLFSYVLANFRGADRAADIQRAVIELATNARGVQAMSFAGRRLGLCSGLPAEICLVDSDCPSPQVCALTAPAGGYGLELTTCAQPGNCNYRVLAFDDETQVIADPLSQLKTFTLRGQSFIREMYYSDQLAAGTSCPTKTGGGLVTQVIIRFPFASQSPGVDFFFTPDPDIDAEYAVAIVENTDSQRQWCLTVARHSGLIAYGPYVP